MNIWLDSMHMFTQTMSQHYHQHICIYEFINNSSSPVIYAITNTFIIHPTYMYFIIHNSIHNIYAFTTITLWKIHQDILERFSTIIQTHKVFPIQFKTIWKMIKPFKTLMIMPRVNSSKNRWKELKVQNRKTRTEATRLPSGLLAMAGKTGLLSPPRSP